MPKRQRQQLTDAEKEAQRERGRQYRAQVDTIANNAMDAAMNDATAWRSALWTAAMHPARPGVVNIAAMAHQAPGQLLDSFPGWRQRGRQVRKGETGPVKIFTAFPRRAKEDEDEERPSSRAVRFRVGTLHAYGQTDPIEGEEQEPQGPPLASPAAQVEKAARALLAQFGEEPDEAADAAAALGKLGRAIYRSQYGAAVTVARTEGTSAAYVAAVMLGISTDSAPLPPMEYVADESDPYSNVRATLERVIFAGRELAQDVKNLL